MTQEYKVGDEVYLKVGGPKMVVEKVVSSAYVRCQWFAGKKLDSGSFAPDSLVREDPNPKVQLGG